MQSAQGGGSLYLDRADSPLPVVVLGSAYVPFDGFTARSPARDDLGVVADVAAGALYLKDVGLWGVGFTVTATGLEPNSGYRLAAFIDGAEINLWSGVTTDNKAIEATFSAWGILRTEKPGAKVELRYLETSGAGGNWITAAAWLSAYKVSA